MNKGLATTQMDDQNMQGDELPKAERPEGASEPPAPRTSRKGILGGVLGFLLALSVGFYAGKVAQCGPTPHERASGKRYKVTLRGDEPSRGPSDALVTIIEFADYECPYCAKANQPLKDALAEFEGEVRLIYKHYPLPGHSQAIPAAQAAWAAHQQGRFWEVHDVLFDHSGNVNEVIDQASALGLDVERFKEDMASQAAGGAVDDDRFAGGKLGLTGTPAFFVNGYRYVGLKRSDQWEQIIQDARDEAQELVDDGVARGALYDKLMEEALDRRRERPEKPQKGGLDPEKTYRVPLQGRPALGPPDALVTMVVFSDFQCPYCRKLGALVHELMERNTDLRVVFRHLPIPKHRRARAAAQASIAAYRQGRFWEMHDRLFERQDALATVDFAVMAEELGLDTAAFARDVADAAMLEEDLRLAAHLKILSTPSVFINGRYLRGAQTRSAYQMLIDEERKKAQALVEQGTAPLEVYEQLMAQAATDVD